MSLCLWRVMGSSLSPVCAHTQLFDVLEDQAAIEFAQAGEEGTTEAAAKTARRLVGQALRLGSTDNISVIVIRL